jgi:hypothetical protein
LDGSRIKKSGGKKQDAVDEILSLPGEGRMVGNTQGAKHFVRGLCFTFNTAERVKSEQLTVGDTRINFLYGA